VVLGFRKNNDGDSEEEWEEEEVDYVLFQGALNGKEANLAENARLAEAGLIPLKELITDALHRRAETVRLEPKGQSAVITFSVDGVWYPGGRVPRQHALAVTQMAKLLAGLNPRERAKPQSGGIKAELTGTKFELKVESTPLAKGVERLIVRARDVEQELEKPEEIGMRDSLKLRIRELMSEKSGITLACGPPRSGTSTTALGILRCIDAYLYSLFSIAKTIDRELNYVTHNEWTEGADFDDTIGRAMRMEADVIFVDPITDAETATTMFNRQAKVGFVDEFAAQDAAHGIMQLYEWLGDGELLANGLKGVVSQRLIRLLCEQCKEAFRPNPRMLAKIGIPPETKVLYRTPTIDPEPEKGEEEPEPCSKCGDIGFMGRTALFEFIEISDGMREVISAGPTLKAIRTQARKEKMPTFQREGLTLVTEGRTALEELQRVLKKS
jgi:type IV pilus assembly protein PilB